jgi:hypothetical protein
MIGALDGGAIKPESNATFHPSRHCGGQRQTALAAALISELINRCGFDSPQLAAGWFSLTE